MQVKILNYLDNITKGNKNYIYYLNDIAEILILKRFIITIIKTIYIYVCCKTGPNNDQRIELCIKTTSFGIHLLTLLYFILYTILRFHFQSLIQKTFFFQNYVFRQRSRSPVSFTNNTDRHYTTEILLNTITFYFLRKQNYVQIQ